MSIQKISNLLQKGEMINYSVMSEHLNAILSEISSIIVEQSHQIEFLKGELGKRPLYSEIHVIKNDLETKLSEKCRNMIDNDKKAHDEISNINNKLDKVSEDLLKKIEDNTSLIDEEIKNRTKDIAGDVFIANQQIREINVKLLSTNNSIQKSNGEIFRIQKLLDTEKDKSVDLLVMRLESVESKVQTIVQNQAQYQTDVSNSYEELKEFAHGLKKEMSSEIHGIHVSLEEVKHMIVEAPTYDIEGVIDTPALIRAIQRDSRRIDAFNETIVAIKDENQTMKSFFNSIFKGIQEMQVHFHDFVEEHNHTKRELRDKTTENTFSLSVLSKDVSIISTHFHSVLDTTLSGMTSISNSIIQLFSFIAKLSSRPVPSSKQLDDIVVDLQHHHDIWNSTNQKLEDRIIKVDQERIFSHRMKSEFFIPYIQIDNPFDILFLDQPGKHIKAQTSSPSGTSIDHEMKYQLNDLQSKVEKNAKSLEALLETVENKIEKKADTLTVERLLEKMRLSLSKIRDTANETSKIVAICVRRDELEKVIQQSIDTSKDPRDSVVFVSRPRTSLNHTERSSNLPSIKGSPHSAIYGNDSVNTQRSSPQPNRVRFSIG